MTANKRIFLNVIATYGRSLFGLACGLFSARWVLEALGKEDFGLYGVVGALAIFIAFINMMLSRALGRYYAFSIGEAKKAEDEGRAADGLENCRRWFNTASFHGTVFAILFHRPFVLILLRGCMSGMNERALSLLKKFGLESRAVYADDTAAIEAALATPIDWERVENLRVAFSGKSVRFFRDGLC